MKHHAVNPASEQAPKRPGPGRLYIYAVSALIGFCIFMQLLAFVPDLHPPYPFHKYPMYARSYTGTPTTERHQLSAVLADGSRVDAGNKPCGLQFFTWNYDYVRKLRWGPGHPKAMEPAGQLASRLENHYGKPVHQLILHTTTYKIVDGQILTSQGTLRFKLRRGEE